MDLGSLNIENIESIINSLSQSDIDRLSAVADSLFSGEQEPNECGKKSSSSSFENFDAQTAKRIMKIMNRLSKQKEPPECALLRALKPMLSPKRQQKTEEAINMLKILSLLPIIEEMKD